MNKKAIVVKGVRTVGEGIKKKSPLLLTIGTVVGIGGVIFTTIKGTRKYDFETEQKSYEYEDNQLPTKEKVKIAAKSYWPVAVTGGAAVACAVGAEVINERRITAATAAYEFTKEAFDIYKDKVKERIGENDAREVEAEAAAEKVKRDQPEIYANPELIPGSGVLFIESMSGQVFRSTVDDIRLEERRFNEDLRGSDWLSLNEWLIAHLGLNGMAYSIGENLGFGERYDHSGMTITLTPSDKVFATGETATVITYEEELVAYNDYTCLNS